MMPALPGPGVSFSAAQLPMMTTLSASDGCRLDFEQGTLVWIEVYSQGDKRWPFYGRPELTGITHSST
ncbi:Uncharacterised protein [Klebsiella pneumoniae]|uniref:hypothetical protein n=1 Tax=Klebsiella pneumoniae TaxID=573 RepID=UPI000E2C4004|nr:hypothetical protein [Klebsiella pneumoniae]SVU02304.1 Uncharacterised protein [Klebsiella pneumoniae]